MMLRTRLSAAVFGAALILLALSTLGGNSGPRFGDPLAGLTADQYALFLAGKAAFEEVETVADGIGPVFNDVSCVSCHSVAATGGGSDIVETRFGRLVNGHFDPMTQFGGSLIQKQGIGLFNGVNFVGETVPRQATIVAGRRTTPLFGLGLVAAVPDATFQQLASLQQHYTPATVGRPNVITDLATGRSIVGRFGWKCQHGSLLSFSADAYLNEMGITTLMAPMENFPQGNGALLAANPALTNPNDLDNDDVEAFSDFMTLLGPPPSVPKSSGAQQGAKTFVGIGCANCHVPAFQTGPSPFAPFNLVTFFPYSDFLLHDMGSLGDGIEQDGAGRTEMRTAPLWGVRVMKSFLHDGRARSLTDAILAHAGQGKGARDRFSGLSKTDKANLIAFLNTL